MGGAKAEEGSDGKLEGSGGARAQFPASRGARNCSLRVISVYVAKQQSVALLLVFPLLCGLGF